MNFCFRQITKVFRFQRVLVFLITVSYGIPATAQPQLWDVKKLHQVPSFKWVNTSGQVRSLLFKGVDYKGAGTDVFAYYSDPDLHSGKRTGKRFPAVVLVHGGGGKAFREWADRWAAAGYAAIAIDFAGYGADGKRLEHPGPDQSHSNKFSQIEQGPLTDVWTYHSVSSILLAHSWLRAQPQILKNKTAITGISWGGYLTCIAAAIDTRFKAAVPVYGCGYYDESDVFKASLMTLSAEGRHRWMTWFDPSVYLPSAKIPFLFLNGNKDRFYNVLPYHKTYSLLHPSKRNVCIVPDMQHNHIAGWEPPEVKAFIDQVLFRNTKLAKVKRIEETPGQIVLSYQSAEPLSTAAFYYTNDVGAKNEQRNWTRQEAQIHADTKKVTTARVKGGFKYGFFHLKDVKNRSASSEFLISD